MPMRFILIVDEYWNLLIYSIIIFRTWWSRSKCTADEKLLMMIGTSKKIVRSFSTKKYITAVTYYCDHDVDKWYLWFFFWYKLKGLCVYPTCCNIYIIVWNVLFPFISWMTLASVNWQFAIEISRLYLSRISYSCRSM